MTQHDIEALTLQQAAGLIKRKEVSPRELTRACLDRVEQWDGHLRAYITVLREVALTQAEETERAVLRGDALGPVYGVPLALKDAFAMRGVRTTGGTKVLDHHVPDYDSAVVERLRQGGAVFLGTLNMHEIAFGVTTANPHYGIARNPWQREHIPGGSSGGSGVAVAASLCLGSVGTDAGGSVRLPAALCGIVGLKPTFGRISRFGTLPLSLTLDHNGPMTKTVTDAALLLQILAGPDRRDPDCSAKPVPDYTQALTGEVKGIRIGLPKEYFADAMDEEVRGAVVAAIRLLEGQGATVEEVSLPHSRYAPATLVGLAMPEASANHARYLKTQAHDYGEEVRNLLYMGMLLPAHRYLQAQRVRALINREIAAALRTVDVLVLPTAAIPAPKIDQRHVTLGEKTVNLSAALPRLTLPFNLSGLPAISVPCGFTVNGLPIGLQVAGRAFAEATVLRVAYAYEQQTSWHRQRPKL